MKPISRNVLFLVITLLAVEAKKYKQFQKWLIILKVMPNKIMEELHKTMLVVLLVYR